MSNPEITPHHNAENPREGYHIDPATVEAIKRHLAPKPEIALPELTPQEAIAQARAALAAAERKRFPDS